MKKWHILQNMPILFTYNHHNTFLSLFRVFYAHFFSIFDDFSVIFARSVSKYSKFSTKIIKNERFFFFCRLMPVNYGFHRHFSCSKIPYTSIYDGIILDQMKNTLIFWLKWPYFGHFHQNWRNNISKNTHLCPQNRF